MAWESPVLLVAGGKGGQTAGAIVGGGIQVMTNQRQGPRLHRVKLLFITAELTAREGHF